MNTHSNFTCALLPVRSHGRALMVLVASALMCCAGDVWAVEKVQYNRDIRPILAENCFACHGPDSASRKAKLRLHQRDAALQQEVFGPGKPADSEVIRRVLATDKHQMPPATSRKKLTAAQKELLQKW